MNDSLELLDGEDSTEMVADQLRDSIDRFHHLQQVATELDPPTQELDDSLREKYHPLFEKEQQRTQELLTKLHKKHPVLLLKVQKAMSNLEQQ